ncbi:DUF7556 family protein [Natrinema halophilum]|uniref:Uncharacterized protein n=1 Tax=Natrinema halophilum TaxID=1699371 RepID=A0A7D5KZ35_9EURY|nr:hypothetical protein [Natrinema halophilum]QLG48400.1 hypothetical protein HYG82_05840 [Natrinema halophilum]
MSLTHSYRTGDSAEVMAAIDRTGERARLVISDVTRDGAWLTVPEAEAVTVKAWR